VTPELVGRVERFDEAAGLGTVRADDGAAYLFHCTQIADGTRTIPVSVTVEFALIPGRHGQWEAGELRQVCAT
jgi:CspA family cold shock protein